MDSEKPLFQMTIEAIRARWNRDWWNDTGPKSDHLPTSLDDIDTLLAALDHVRQQLAEATNRYIVAEDKLRSMTEMAQSLAIIRDKLMARAEAAEATLAEVKEKYGL